MDNKIKSFDEWKQDRMEQDSSSAKVVLIVIVMLALIAGLTSCATNGYGCKGRSKLITRVPQ